MSSTYTHTALFGVKVAAVVPRTEVNESDNLVFQQDELNRGRGKLCEELSAFPLVVPRRSPGRVHIRLHDAAEEPIQLFGVMGSCYDGDLGRHQSIVKVEPLE